MKMNPQNPNTHLPFYVKNFGRAKNKKQQKYS